MPKKPNQKIKLLYLMEILQENTDDEHGMTLAEISAALERNGVEAERKTLYDDIETLIQFGLDIEKRRSDTVRYHIVSREFELAELKLLVDAVQSSKFISAKKSEALIKKIEGFTSRFEAQQLHRQVYVANRVKTMNERSFYAVDDIHNAIESNRQISFLYFRYNANKKKEYRHGGERLQVSPWALTWDDENYYMIAYDATAEKIKHYRVDKMEKTAVCDDKREGKDLFKNFDMAQYSKQTFGMYGGEEEAVTLRCDAALAGVMLDRFGDDVSIRNVTADTFELRAKVYVSPQFLGWILSFGDKVKILSPERVQTAHIDLAKQGLAQYK